MKPFIRRCRTLGVAALFIGSLAISGCSTLDKINPFSKSTNDNTAGRSDVQPKVKEGSPFVSQSKSGYVRIDAIEAGAAPNDQPISFTTTQIRGALSLLKTASGDEALFNDSELNEIAAPLAAALSRAGPREDVLFAVAGGHGALSALRDPLVTSGRVFYKSGALNIIFGEIRAVARDQLTAQGFLGFFVLREFPAGSRGRASPSAQLLASGNVAYAANSRRDWVQIAAQGVPAPLTVTRTVPSAGAAPPAEGASPAPAAVSGGAEPDIERRLTLLKSLRDKGLITEQEYNDKRKEILKNL